MEVATHTWSCPICGMESAQRYLASRSQLPPGPPDLDTRAFADKAEDVLRHEVWRCPECGYASAPSSASAIEGASGIEVAPDAVATLVHSDSYRAQLDETGLPELARSYLCRAMVEAAQGRLARAGWTALAAAWVCDEGGEQERARSCRRRAAELWSEAEEADQAIVAQGLPAAQLVLADVLRRSGDFERARRCCHRGLSGRPEEPFRSLLEFELELITAEDTDPHSVEEAVGPWE